MKPIEKVLFRLGDYRKSGKGFTARCPAHDDHNPSLSIGESEDGKVLLRCHAGCTLDEILRSVELTQSDLFPDDFTPSLQSDQSRQGFPSPEEAIHAYNLNAPVSRWTYHDAEGSEVGIICRWDTPKGKVIRPVARTASGWAQMMVPKPRPLFNLNAVTATAGETIFVVEGEKCVDAMTALGLTATTSMGGSQAPHLTDWTALTGRTVAIVPDNDAAGRDYANAVESLVAPHAGDVLVIELDGLGEGGDVGDLVDACLTGRDREELKARLIDAVAKARVVSQCPANGERDIDDTYRLFPVELLPQAASCFVEECSAAVGCDAAFVALPVLTLLGAAIGNTRRLFLKTTHRATAILWTGIVGESGTGKTPALNAALAMAHAHELSLRSEKEPRRFVVSDTTTEALALLMARNPRGIMCVCDELAGWLGAIDRYRDQRARCSADRSFLLSAHTGVPHTIDRRTGDPRHITIPRTSLWVTGGIQPSVLAHAMGKAERESGLLARLLLACPPVRPQKFSDADVSDETRNAFETLVAELLALSGDADVMLTPDAKARWAVFNDDTAEEACYMTGDLAAAWSKFRDTALRLALILHLAERVTGPVSLATMERAITLTRWFQAETRRVYGILAQGSARRREGSHETTLQNWMLGRGLVTERDIRRGPRPFREEAALRRTLSRMIEDGVVEKVSCPTTAQGGTPTTKYQLRTGRPR
jgi:hypothetical protein